MPATAGNRSETAFPQTLAGKNQRSYATSAVIVIPTGMALMFRPFHICRDCSENSEEELGKETRFIRPAQRAGLVFGTPCDCSRILFFPSLRPKSVTRSNSRELRKSVGTNRVLLQKVLSATRS